ncbi:MAG: 3-isopropylmalate dehydratase small subunit [Burkholderiaceae bacterium]
MDKFTNLESKAIRLGQRNIDTDRIVPARFLRTPRKEGYADFLFHDERVGPDERPIESFPLNLPANAGAQVLVAGENFGCGSSREGAVYALYDWGIRSVIAPSFGDIFRTNCFKNGLLPIQLSAEEITTLFGDDETVAGAAVAIDLGTQTIRTERASRRFEIEPFWKECLLEGIDDIDLTLRHQAEITAFANHRLARHPWLRPEHEARP